jgi:DNA-binding NarL/FixJ family response regulator
MPEPFRVLIVDDHDLVRAVLREMVDCDDAFVVVGEAADAGEALEQVLTRRPDILVIDIDMPGVICFEAVKQMLARLSDLSVLFLSAFFHDHYIKKAIDAGAKGYVLKGDSPVVLFEALRKIAYGGVFFSAGIRSRITLDEDGRPLRVKPTRPSKLTNREVEVLCYLAHGLSKKEIARTIHRSVKTIEHHSASLMHKLDIHDRVELTRYAIREGLAEVWAI